MLVYKLDEPPYNLRSKGKMTAIDDPSKNSLVVAENPGGSGGKDDTRNDEHVARMEHEMDLLGEEVQQIRELAHLAMMTLQQTPRFPSLDLILDHFPSST